MNRITWRWQFFFFLFYKKDLLLGNCERQRTFSSKRERSQNCADCFERQIFHPWRRLNPQLLLSAWTSLGTSYNNNNNLIAWLVSSSDPHFFKIVQYERVMTKQILKSFVVNFCKIFALKRVGLFQLYLL